MRCSFTCKITVRPVNEYRSVDDLPRLGITMLLKYVCSYLH